MKFTTTTALAALSVFGSLVTAIDTIEIKDRHFVNSKTGDPFFIKGVDYQPGGAADVSTGTDPLSDADTCARDIFLFQKLGINTIRVYSVDPTLDHNACMTMLAAAGIYLVLDVNSPLENQHLNNQVPWTTYTPMYLEHVFSVIEVFSGYDNTLAFLAGNEVIFDSVSAQASPNYVKAVVRDMKAYIQNHISRAIPVGYSNADDLLFRVSLAQYLECGDTGFIDFFGVNSYQWCGDNTFQGSGYDTLVEDYANYSLPVFFTEYGCNVVRPRKWEEVASIYSQNMTGVFSGGLVYEFTQESNDYGLVQISSDQSVQTLAEYDTLLTAFANAPKAPTIPSDVQIYTRPTTCGAASTFPNINGNTTLPDTLGADMIKNGLPSSANVTQGVFLTSNYSLETTYTIKDTSGNVILAKSINATSSTNGSVLHSSSSVLNSTSNSPNSTSNSLDSTSKSLESTSKSLDSTSKSLNSTSNSLDSTSKSLNSTSNSPNFPSKSLNSTSKSPNSTFNSLNFPSNSPNPTSKSLNSTSNSLNFTSNSSSSTSTSKYISAAASLSYFSWSLGMLALGVAVFL
ncbi:Glycolipid anchored surface protein 4 precursor [Rhizina undulata]